MEIVPAATSAKARSFEWPSGRNDEVSETSSWSPRIADLGMAKLFQELDLNCREKPKVCKTYSPTASSFGSS
jgi:hypothetical protein